MFNISLPFILFDNMKEKTIFHLLTEGVLNEIFLQFTLWQYSVWLTRSLLIRKNILTEEKVCLIVKFDYNILYGISVHLWKRN